MTKMQPQCLVLVIALVNIYNTVIQIFWEINDVNI